MEPNQIQAECARVRRAIPNYEDVVPSVVPSGLLAREILLLVI